MCKVYGYCRISTKKQSIERQVRNIKAEYPNAIIITEAFTGTKIEGRKEFMRLLKGVTAEDTIVFDSVSRMSRNADSGIELYFDLVERGVNLVFLKEHYIDSDTYKSSMVDRIALTGTDEDEIFKGINNYFRKLAERQIRIAFEQSEKEVKDLQQRTKEGIQTVKEHNAKIEAGIEDGDLKQIGQAAGKKLTVKKAEAAKEIIRKYSSDFEGTLSDIDVMKLAGVSRNSYYKYKNELKKIIAGV